MESVHVNAVVEHRLDLDDERVVEFAQDGHLLLEAARCRRARGDDVVLLQHAPLALVPKRMKLTQ